MDIAKHETTRMTEWPMTLQRDIGVMTISHPVAVYSDACHWKEDGYHPGLVDTLDSLVTVLIEQSGWAEVTAPSDISIDGYAGKAFHRTTPADKSDCSTRTLMVHDCRRAPAYTPTSEAGTTQTKVPGGFVITNRARSKPCGSSTSMAPSSSSTQLRSPSLRQPLLAHFAADVLDSIRIEPTMSDVRTAAPQR